MTSHKDRGWNDERKGLVTRRNHAIDVSAAAVVDEWIKPAEEAVAGVQDIYIGQKDGYVRVGVGGRVTGQCDLVPIGFHRPRMLECHRWQRAVGPGWINALEFRDELLVLHPRKGFLVCEDGCTSCVHPLIPISMVEVPMRIDEESQWIGRDRLKRLRHLNLRSRKATIDDKLAIGSWKHENVPS